MSPHSASLVLPLAAALLAAAPRGQTGAVRATNAFACNLFGELRSAEGNLFFSPYSIGVALAMTRAGARGQTATEMDEVLQLTGTDAGGEHMALAKALLPRKVSTVRNRPAVDAYQLHLANALWGQEGVAFLDPFTRALKSQFGAPLARIDFRDTAAARKRINDWVAKQTRDKVLNIVPENLPTPDTVLTLANAIYFKASWYEPFSKRRTKDAPFTLGSGKLVDVPMMRRAGQMRYGATDDVQVLEIPYRGGDSTMVLVLPKRKDGLRAVEAKLTSRQLDSWLAGMTSVRVDLQLPRFRFETALDLIPTLKQMGMAQAFRPDADFSGMTAEERLFIGAVLHKSFVAVDEAGTEAAAATVVMMMRGSIPRDPIAFSADHPFLFAIRHKKTGCILFMGRVNDPRS